MTLSLPPKPSLRHLREQAKDLLKAQRHRDAGACPTLRRLRRFRDASDGDILGAHVALHEAQFALAMEYGFANWPDLIDRVRQMQPPGEVSLDAVRAHCRQELPEYAGAGVPLAIVAVLNHAGQHIDYIDFVAATGWAFSFGYKYGDISPAYLAVCGSRKKDGPTEVFRFIPERLGFDYQWAPMRDTERLWAFVVEHSGRGIPIVSEYLDGGLVTGHREQDGQRQVYCDQTVGDPGWTNIAEINQFGGFYVLTRHGEGEPWNRIVPQALRRAVQKGSPHEWEGVPQGLAALKAYHADVADPSKGFADCAEWFCWAAFERLAARRCAALWLNSLAASWPGPARKHLTAAAMHYHQAAAAYEQYRAAVSAGEPTPLTFEQRARTAERIAVSAPLLRQGIDAEAAGLDALASAASAVS